MLQVSLQDAAKTCVNARRYMYIYSSAGLQVEMICLELYIHVYVQFSSAS